jgi:hypothetical protein
MMCKCTRNQAVQIKLGVVAHVCNPSTWEAEEGRGILSLRSAWATE